MRKGAALRGPIQTENPSGGCEREDTGGGVRKLASHNGGANPLQHRPLPLLSPLNLP